MKLAWLKTQYHRWLLITYNGKGILIAWLLSFRILSLSFPSLLPPNLFLTSYNRNGDVIQDYILWIFSKFMCARGDRCPPPTISEVAYYYTNLVHQITYPSLDIFIYYLFFFLTWTRYDMERVTCVCCQLPTMGYTSPFSNAVNASRPKSTEVNLSQPKSTQVNSSQRKATQVNSSQPKSINVNAIQDRTTHPFKYTSDVLPLSTYHLTFFSFLFLFFLYSKNHFAIIHEVRKRINILIFHSSEKIARWPNKGRTILI